MPLFTPTAPVNADYLIGTANAALTAEITVGTSPGGELGGTWASPTVDATHSGSAHVALTANAPQTVGTSNTLGTGTASAKDDHVHAHEAAHINHDTTWAAKGDLIAGTGNDAASVLGVGADDTLLVPSAAAGTGLKYLAVGFGHTAATHAVSLTTASAFVTATTSLSAATYADITGATVTLAAGTWLIMGNVFATDTTTTAGLLVAAITDSANNLVCEGAQSIPAGTATVSTWGHVALAAFVSPGSSTTYKLRGARGTTTATATLVVQDGSPQNVANNATTNTDKGTGIFAVRLA